MTAGDTKLTVNFTPGSLGAGTFTRYEVATNAAFTENKFTSTTESDRSIDITGLTNGTTYTVYLRAVSDIGGGASASDAGNTPLNEPTAPTIGTVTVGDTKLTVNFTPGSLEGGTFTRYEVATNAPSQKTSSPPQPSQTAALTSRG